MRSVLLGILVTFALASCGEPEDGWMFTPGAGGGAGGGGAPTAVD